MRVLLITDGLGGGGAERVVTTLADSLQQLGNEVAIISVKPLRAYDVAAGISVYDVEPSPEALADRLRHMPQFDLVVSNQPLADRITTQVPQLRDAWLCLHTPIATAGLAGRGKLRRTWKRLRLRRVYNKRNIIAVSQGIITDAVEQHVFQPRAAEVIPNPFHVEQIQILAEAPCPLEDQQYIIHVGRIHRVKRHDRLLQAYARSGISERLVVLGSGSPDRLAALQQLAATLGIAERVTFIPFQRNPYPYIRAARALVLSSDLEGFGNVLVEALICGTPIVSTNCPTGPADIMTGELARGLSALDADSLAEAIVRVLHDPPVIRPEQYERFHAQRVAQQYLALAHA